MRGRERANWLTGCLLGWLVSGVPTAIADIYKYVDGAGNVYFTDVPLKGDKYRLEWRRESQKIARDTRSQAPPPRSNRAALVSGLQGGAGSTPAPGRSLLQRRALYAALVEANARRYRLPPELLHAVIRAESAYNPLAVSPAGAQGLMQLMPGTAARYGVADSFDPAQNIRGGAAYLRDLLDLFEQDTRLALAGYNAGEGAVIRHGRQIPPYAETQTYVRRVMQFLWVEQPGGIALSAR